MKRLNHRGDTLIEVMIALAVLGAVLGGAYASASNSLRTARHAQERSEALKVAESQLERIKVHANALDPSAIFIGDIFCVNTTNDVVTMPGISRPLPELETAPLTQPAPFDPACVTDNRYYTLVAYDAAASDQFTVLVRWERLGGGRDEIRFVYRVHQSS